MDKLSQIISTAVPLHNEDVDTDQIIPARFLKATSREGFGENLFRDWRYDRQGNAIKDFVLNNTIYSGDVLFAGKNFGCGSSREHAAWALYDYGFKVVVSSFFADIFKGNALNNGLLPITLDEKELSQAFTFIETNPSTLFEIDVETQTIKNNENNWSAHFDLDPYKKLCLINGYTDLDYLLNLKNKIEEFEKQQVIF